MYYVNIAHRGGVTDTCAVGECPLLGLYEERGERSIDSVMFPTHYTGDCKRYNVF